MRPAYLAAALSVALVPVASMAQTLPVPNLPPQLNAPELGADPWEYALSTGIAWDNNVDFLVPDGPSGSALNPRGEVRRRFSGPRGGLLASLAAQWYGYVRGEFPNRSYAEAGLEGEYKLSTRTKLRGDARFFLGYSDATTTLIEQGVPLPLVKTRSVDARVLLSQDLSPHYSLELEGRLYRTVFDEGGAVDGASQRGTIGLSRKLSNRSSAGITYAFEGVSAGTPAGTYATHFGSLQLTRTLSPFSAILVEGGASYTPDALQAGLDRASSFFGGVTYIRRVRRARLLGYVRQETTPAFGLGISRRETRVGLMGHVQLGKDWTLRLLANFSQPWPPSGDSDEVAYSSYADANSSIARRMGRRLVLSADIRYRRRGQTTVSRAVSAFQVGVFVKLESPSWR